MSLLDFAEELAAFGLPLLAEPAADHPEIPAGEYPVLFLTVPAQQAELLLATDGFDPTHINDEAIPTNGEARRLLAMLRHAQLITAWHAFLLDNETCGVHVQLNREQAEIWYSLIDFQQKTNGETGRLNIHTFA